MGDNAVGLNDYTTQRKIGVLEVRQRLERLEARLAELEARQSDGGLARTPVAPGAGTALYMLNVRHGFLMQTMVVATNIQPDSVTVAVAKLRDDHIAWVRVGDDAHVARLLNGGLMGMEP